MFLVGWMVWIAGLIVLTIRSRKQPFSFERRSLVWFAILSLLVLVLTPFFGLEISTNSQQTFYLMLFAAVPWMVAAGMLGMVPAMLLAGLAGTLTAYLDTHNIFTPLVWMTAAFIFTLSIRQRYRTPGFRLLRFPLVAVLFTGLVLTPFIFGSLIVNQTGDYATRVLISLAAFPEALLATGGSLLIGGVICVIVQAVSGSQWGDPGVLRPAPGEVDLRFRYGIITTLVMLVVLIGVSIRLWNTTSNETRHNVVRTMTQTVTLISGELPGIIPSDEVGQPSMSAVRLSESQLISMAISDLVEMGGVLQIVGRDGQVLFHPDPVQVLTSYAGATFQTSTFFETPDPTGFSQLNFYQPINELAWAVVATVPGISIPRQAINSVQPVFLTGFALILFSTIASLIVLGRIRKQANELASAAEKAAQGVLEPHLKSQFKGEMAALANNFMQMLLTLRSRMQKQSELLSVSERLTGQVKLQDSLQVILMAALEHGVSSARIVLLSDSLYTVKNDMDQRFGVGQDTKALAALDEDVLAVTQMRGLWLLQGDEVGKQFQFMQAMPVPAFMTGLPLRWKNHLLGVLWLAYRERIILSEEELSYFKELAQKAATAIITTRAFDESLTMRKRLQSALAKLSDPVFITDEDGKVVYLNEMAEKVPRLVNKQIIGSPLSSLFEDEKLSALIRNGKKSPVSTELDLGDGRYFQVVISPLEIDGYAVGAACVLKDFTAIKQRDQLKNEFVTTVSHELRSPLTLVNGYAKILRLTGNLNAQQETYVENIIDGVQEMRDLVQNLLDLGRLDSGEMLEMEEITVEAIVNKVLESMSAHAKQKQIELALDLPEQPIAIEADPTFLTQALKNLVENAIKYSKSGKTVRIGVRQQETDVVFTVQDDGPGIAPLDQRKIFKRFFRTDGLGDPEQPSSGCGLGLAIVKSIAEQHGGKVWFDSSLGRGSSFYLEIPLRHGN